MSTTKKTDRWTVALAVAILVLSALAIVTTLAGCGLIPDMGGTSINVNVEQNQGGCSTCGGSGATGPAGQPTPGALLVTATASSSGSNFTVSVLGGTAPYALHVAPVGGAPVEIPGAFSGADTTSQPIDLEAGRYVVTVTDSSSPSRTGSATVVLSS